MRAAYAIAVSAFVLLAGVSCGGSDQDSDLKGVPWRWSGLLVGGDSTGLSPIADPANYLLRLDDDGSFIARADCKSVAGTYSLSGSDLTLELTPTAKRRCGKDSRAVEYIALLRRVATYDLYEKGSLALGLKENVGYLYFYAPAQ
jgi:heat shock protein HslJ